MSFPTVDKEELFLQYQNSLDEIKSFKKQIQSGLLNTANTSIADKSYCVGNDPTNLRRFDERVSNISQNINDFDGYDNINNNNNDNNNNNNNSDNDNSDNDSINNDSATLKGLLETIKIANLLYKDKMIALKSTHSNDSNKSKLIATNPMELIEELKESYKASQIGSNHRSDFKSNQSTQNRLLQIENSKNSIITEENSSELLKIELDKSNKKLLRANEIISLQSAQITKLKEEFSIKINYYRLLLLSTFQDEIPTEMQLILEEILNSTTSQTIPPIPTFTPTTPIPTPTVITTPTPTPTPNTLTPPARITNSTKTINQDNANYHSYTDDDFI